MRAGFIASVNSTANLTFPVLTLQVFVIHLLRLKLEQMQVPVVRPGLKTNLILTPHLILDLVPILIFRKCASRE